MRSTMPLASHVGLVVVALAMNLNAGVAAADVVAVLSVKSSLNILRKDQLIDIFLGKTSRFPDGSEAVAIDQVEGSAPRDEFYLRFADKSPAQIKAHWSKIIFTGRGQPPREVSNSAEVIRQLAANPNAIGYIERERVDRNVKIVVAP